MRTISFAACLGIALGASAPARQGARGLQQGHCDYTPAGYSGDVVAVCITKKACSKQPCGSGLPAVAKDGLCNDKSGAATGNGNLAMTAYRRIALVQLPGDLTDHLLVIPEHKLLFCFIAKNNCLSFNDLFRSLRERYDPSLAEGPNFGRNSYTNHNMTLEQLTEYVYDPAWHKAVFYREPLVRFVSAFRSKCVREPHAGNGVCQAEFGRKYPQFTEVVGRLARGPPVSNPHWRPQADFCGGLSGMLSEFQTIEPLDARTSREKVAKLLKQVGIEDPESIPAFNERFPPPDPKTGVWHPEESPFHTTNADSVVQEYYTPYLACTVFQYYLDDYLLFGIPAPAWTRKWDFHAQQWARVDCATLKEDT
ncbi:Sulfotransferase family-domain-containing protein [Tribonema minus]|uniref:Sulfotransferase family-domain-containing protein n=1 Tax=Tribonema minus TaxID=303371 RepID=A0A835YXU8_9STRA|nr:Sulfotransferase family-domain-containing protein [Tribonema minus]